MEAPILESLAGLASGRISVRTSRARQFLDLTDEVQALVTRSGFQNGLVVVTSQHTTASMTVNEHEPELHRDLDRFLVDLAPENEKYRHNGVPHGPGEVPNGHAHCQALLLNTSVTLPLVDGSIALGRYQRIFLVELDRPRPRSVLITILGA